jgi:hypothetical protein
MRTSRLAAVAGLILLAACREQGPPEISRGRLVRAEGGSARSLLALVPDACLAGEAFRPEPNGDSALVVVGTGLTRGDAVLWNGRRLKTAFGSSRTLSASVPRELLVSPGRVEVRVEDPTDRSRAALRGLFWIRPAPSHRAAEAAP